MASGSWDTARQVIIALNVPNIDDIWVEHSTMDESINLQTYIYLHLANLHIMYKIQGSRASNL